MSPRQVIAMAASPAVAIALLAIVIGLPLGAWLFHLLLSVLVGAASVDIDQPMFTMGVVDLSSSVFVAVLAMAAAVAGALIPASWAAGGRSPTPSERSDPSVRGNKKGFQTWTVRIGSGGSIRARLAVRP